MRGCIDLKRRDFDYRRPVSPIECATSRESAAVARVCETGQ